MAIDNPVIEIQNPWSSGYLISCYPFALSALNFNSACIWARRVIWPESRAARSLWTTFLEKRNVLKSVYKIWNWVFRCSYFYYPINPDKTLHSDAARLPPISHQRVMCFCTSYTAGSTCTKWQKADFHFETKSIGHFGNAFSYHLKWSL